jgi:hypothetical protein
MQSAVRLSMGALQELIASDLTWFPAVAIKGWTLKLAGASS